MNQKLLKSYNSYEIEELQQEIAHLKAIEKTQQALLNQKDLEIKQLGAELQTQKKSLDASSLYKYYKIFNQINVAICVLSADNQLIECNLQALDILGYAKDTYLGSNLYDYFHPDDLSQQASQFEQLLKGKLNQYSLEARFKTAEGNYKWLLLTAVLSSNPLLHTTTRFLTIIDIDEYKRYKQHFQYLQTQLNLATISGKVGVWEIDLRQNQMNWHKSMYELTGYGAQDFESDVENKVSRLIPITDFAKIQESLQKAIQEQETHYRVEHRFHVKGGESRTFSVEAKIIRDETDNQPIRIIGTSTDITEQKKYERKTRQLLRQFQKSNRRLLEQQFSIEKHLQEMIDLNEIINESKSELEKANGELQASVTYAQRIQEAILPLQEEIAEVLPDHFILYKPKDIVSGDFYWFTQKPYKAIIAAVDCTGHGIPGAFMSLIGNDLLHEIVEIRNIIEPNKILDELRREIHRVLKQEITGNNDGMDISICTIDLFPPEIQNFMGKPKLEFASAGNPMLYIQNNELYSARADRIILGGHEFYHIEDNFNKQTIDISIPTTFYIYSDGYRDQHGGLKGKRFSVQQFKEVLLKIHHLPLAEQKQILDDTITKWMGTEFTQTDDILVIGVRV